MVSSWRWGLSRRGNATSKVQNSSSYGRRGTLRRRSASISTRLPRSCWWDWTTVWSILCRSRKPVMRTSFAIRSTTVASLVSVMTRSQTSSFLSPRIKSLGLVTGQVWHWFWASPTRNNCCRCTRITSTSEPSSATKLERSSSMTSHT